MKSQFKIVDDKMRTCTERDVRNRPIAIDVQQYRSAMTAALLGEAKQLGARVAMTGSVTNAIALGMMPARRRTELTACMPSGLFLSTVATSQLARIGDVPWCGLLQSTRVELVALITMTSDWIKSDAADIDLTQASEIAGRWRSVASRWQDLIEQIVFDAGACLRSTSVDGYAAVLATLRGVSLGQTPCVAAGGLVNSPGWVDRRRCPRYEGKEHVTVYGSLGPMPAVLRDVSEAGFGVAGLVGSCKGQRLVVALADGRHIKGTVTNIRNDRTGLFLDRLLQNNDSLLTRFRDGERAQ